MMWLQVDVSKLVKPFLVVFLFAGVLDLWGDLVSDQVNDLAGDLQDMRR